MANRFRLEKVLGKVRRLFSADKRNTEPEVKEIKNSERHKSQLNATDFDHQEERLIQMPRPMVASLIDEKVENMLTNIQEKHFNDSGTDVYVATDKHTGTSSAHESIGKRPWYSKAVNRGGRIPIGFKPESSTSHFASEEADNSHDKPWHSRVVSRRGYQSDRSEVETSSQNSRTSEDTRPCTLKLRREDRKGLDILHDCMCYNQVDMRHQTHARSQAQVINEFLNTITNDIVDVNKEPIPKDPERLPALGAAGMYPTKKWLADLRRRGIKPEPNKHFKVLRAGALPKRLRYRGESVKEERRSVDTRSKSFKKNGGYREKKRPDAKNAALIQMTRMLSSRQSTTSSSDDSSVNTKKYSW